VAEAREAVVLVHGLWYRGLGMLPLARRMKRSGFETFRPSWATLRGDFLDSADRLADYAASRRREPLHYVGHSLGGLLVLKMLERHGERLPRGRVVLLGCPVRGSGVARRMAATPGLRALLGGSTRALTAGFAHAPPERDVGVIAGTAGVGAGRLLGGLPSPHDGTVAVAETDLPNRTARLELPVTHTGLVLAATVANEVAGFLREARFGRGSRDEG
jgi:pimeloyl-ACP methyl ester carboxylesterase